MADKDKIQAMLDAIREVTDLGGTWQEKKNAVLEHADEIEKNALYEFIAWFE